MRSVFNLYIYAAWNNITSYGWSGNDDLDFINDDKFGIVDEDDDEGLFDEGGIFNNGDKGIYGDDNGTARLLLLLLLLKV